MNPRLIEKVLTQLAQCFSDTKKLRERYGLHLVQSSLQLAAPGPPAIAQGISALADSPGGPSLPISDEVRADLLKKAGIIKDKNAFPKRLFWATWDKTKFRKFIGQIHDLVQTLWRTMDDSRLEALSKDVNGAISHLVRVEEKVDQLLALSLAIGFTSSDIKEIPNQEDPEFGESALGAAAHIKAERNKFGHDEAATTEGVDLDHFAQVCPAVPVESFSRKKLYRERKLVGTANIVAARFRDADVVVEWKVLHEDSKRKILTRVRN